MRIPSHKLASVAPTKAAAATEPAESGSSSIRGTLGYVPPELRPVEREFLRVPDVEHVFGLKRGTLYGLLRDGKIKSVCLRKTGAATGIRLISASSIRDWFNAQMEGAE